MREFLGVKAPGYWRSKQVLDARTYNCGFCTDKVSSSHGYATCIYADGSGNVITSLYICPGCNMPTYFLGERSRFPGEVGFVKFGHVPADIATLFDEAKISSAMGSHTASVLICRKLLMHIGVHLGAKPGESFVSYVEHIASAGYVPPNGKGWLDYIRTRGNEANHEIQIMKDADSKALIQFIDMLLKLVYEFPASVPSPT